MKTAGEKGREGKNMRRKKEPKKQIKNTNALKATKGEETSESTLIKLLSKTDHGSCATATVAPCTLATWQGPCGGTPGAVWQLLDEQIRRANIGHQHTE